MHSKTILVTGGGGYIGSLLCGELLSKGARVRVYDSLYFGEGPISQLLTHNRFELVKGDMRFIESNFSILDDVDGVCHLASLSNDPSCDLREDLSIDINLKGTIKLVRECKRRGIRRFIFMSSCSAYGAATEDVVNESSPLNPVSLYAKTKIEAEKEIMALSGKDFLPTSLRQATVFGFSPRMRFDLAINMMTMHGLTKKEIFVMGGGKQWRPFIHVKDSVDAVMKVLESPLDIVGKETFNLGTNSMNFRIYELARLVQSCFSDVHVEIAPDDADKRSYRVDFSKAEENLGFKGKYSPEYGVREIIDAFKNGDIKNFADPLYYNILTMQEYLRKPGIAGGEPYRSRFLFIKPDILSTEKLVETVESGLDRSKAKKFPTSVSFEKRIKKTLGIENICCSKSYEAALALVLYNLNISEGSRLIVSPAISETLLDLLVNLPVELDFVDLNESNLILDSKKAASLIGDKTSLIVTNAPFGNEDSLSELLRLSSGKNVPLLIDSNYGSLFDITKDNFGADVIFVSSLSSLEVPGEMNIGIISTSSQGRYEFFKKLLRGEKSASYSEKPNPIFKYLLKELGASGINLLFCKSQLSKFDMMKEHRQNLIELYNRFFRKSDELKQSLKIILNVTPYLSYYPIILSGNDFAFDELPDYFKGENIEIERGFGSSTTFDRLEIQNAIRDLDVYQSIRNRLFFLPFHSDMGPDDLRDVTSTFLKLADYFKGR